VGRSAVTTEARRHGVLKKQVPPLAVPFGFAQGPDFGRDDRILIYPGTAEGFAGTVKIPTLSHRAREGWATDALSQHSSFPKNINVVCLTLLLPVII
jgi:hypothetical protein